MKTTPETIASNYPRATDVPTLSAKQAAVTLKTTDTIERLVTISLLWVVITVVVFLFAVQRIHLLVGSAWLVIALVVWTLLFRRVKRDLWAYAEVAGWSSPRTLGTCAMLYSAFVLLPGLAFLVLINHWICKDLKKHGINSPSGYVPRAVLQQIAGRAEEEKDDS